MPTPPPPTRKEYFFAYAAEKRRKAEKYLIDNFVPKAPEISTKKSAFDYTLQYGSGNYYPYDYTTEKTIISAIKGHNKPILDFLNNNGLFPLIISSTPSVDINNPIVEEPNQSVDIVYFEDDDAPGFQNINGIDIRISNNSGSVFNDEATITTSPTPINILSIENNYTRNINPFSDISGMSDPIVKYITRNEQYEGSDSNNVEIPFSSEKFLKNTIKEAFITSDESNSETTEGVHKSNEPNEKQMDYSTTTDITPSLTFTYTNVSDLAPTSQVDSSTLSSQGETFTEIPRKYIVNVGSSDGNTEETREIWDVIGDNNTKSAPLATTISPFEIITTSYRPTQFLPPVVEVERSTQLSDGTTKLSERFHDLPEDFEAKHSKSNKNDLTTAKENLRLSLTSSTIPENKSEDTTILKMDMNTSPSEIIKDEFDSSTSSIIIHTDLDLNLKLNDVYENKSDSTSISEKMVTSLSSPIFDTVSIKGDESISSQIVKNVDTPKHYEATTFTPYFRDVSDNFKNLDFTPNKSDISEEVTSETPSTDAITVEELKSLNFSTASVSNIELTTYSPSTNANKVEESRSMDYYNPGTSESNKGATLLSPSTNAFQVEKIKAIEYSSGTGIYEETASNSSTINKEELKSMNFSTDTGSSVEVTSSSPSADAIKEGGLRSMNYSTGTESYKEATTNGSSTEAIGVDELKSLYYLKDTESNVGVTTFSPSTESVKSKELLVLDYLSGTVSHIEEKSFSPSSDAIKVEELRSLDYSTGMKSNTEVTTFGPSTEAITVGELRTEDYLMGAGNNAEMTTFISSAESAKVEEVRSMDYLTGTGNRILVTTFSSSTESAQVEELRSMDYSTGTGNHVQVTAFSPPIDANIVGEIRSLESSTGMGSNLKFTTFSPPTEAVQLKELREIDFSTDMGNHVQVTTFSSSTEANEVEEIRLLESLTGMRSNVKLTTFSSSTEAVKLEELRAMDYSTGMGRHVEVTTFNPTIYDNKYGELQSLDNSTGTESSVKLTTLSPSTEAATPEEFKSMDISTMSVNIEEVTTFRPLINAIQGEDLKSMEISNNVLTTDEKKNTNSTKIYEVDVMTLTPSPSNSDGLKSLVSDGDDKLEKQYFEITTIRVTSDIIKTTGATNEIEDMKLLSEPMLAKIENQTESIKTGQTGKQIESRDLIYDPETTLPSITPTLEDKYFTLEPMTVFTINNIKTTSGEINSVYKTVNYIEETPNTERTTIEDSGLLRNMDITIYPTQPSLNSTEIDSVIPLTKIRKSESSTELYLEDEKSKYNDANVSYIDKTITSSNNIEVFDNFARSVNFSGLYDTTTNSNKMNPVDAIEKHNNAIYPLTTDAPPQMITNDSFIITERPDITLQEKSNSPDKMQSNIDDTIDFLKSITSQVVSSELNKKASNPIEEINSFIKTHVTTENYVQAIPKDSESIATVLENNTDVTKSQYHNRMPKKIDDKQYNLNTFSSDVKHSLKGERKSNFHRRSDISPEEDYDI